MLKPVLTEKSLNEAKEGKYTFIVDVRLNKFKIKDRIEKTFKVHVVKVRTLKVGGEVKKTMQGRIRIISALKKAIVVLREKEKIDLFETKK